MKRHCRARASGVFLALPIQAYRLLVSPVMLPSCRFLPSCSDYAVEALRRHGAGRGLMLTLRRLARCHPWGGSGYDPVPEAGVFDGRNARDG